MVRLPDVEEDGPFARVLDEAEKTQHFLDLCKAVDEARAEFWRADRAEIVSRVDSVDGSGVRFDRDAQLRRDLSRAACDEAVAAREASRDPKV